MPDERFVSSMQSGEHTQWLHCMLGRCLTLNAPTTTTQKNPNFSCLSFVNVILFLGKWHLGLNCERSDDHCHHPSVHGFNYFFGIPLTNIRDCQAGHGTVFQIQKYLPYRTMGIVLVTATFLHYSGIIAIRRRLILSLLSLLVLAAGLMAGFILIIPYFNCVLMRDHTVVEQPFTSENLTQTMTYEAVDFIERYMSALSIHMDQRSLISLMFLIKFVPLPTFFL